MKRFIVRWEVEVDALTPAEAAELGAEALDEKGVGIHFHDDSVTLTVIGKDDNHTTEITIGADNG